MVLYLGIDGGGTGCRAAIADATGRILGRAEGGPANINSDPQGATVAILATATAAMVQAGATPQDVIAVLGLAGGGMPEAARATEARLPFARSRVVNDAVTAARGALGAGDGILVAVGTGSVFAVQRGGVLEQRGGRGFLMGDEGSGAVLGRNLLSEAMRAGDGFAPDSPLLQDIRHRMGGFQGIIAFGNRASPAEFAQMARRLVDHRDDPAASRVLDAAASQIDHAVAVLQAGADLPVVCTGGLGPFYAERLAARWSVRPAQGSATDGAIAMARELGIPA
ncbi:BadF/BadG/BcrA/BcrD ATPase family protein [Paracoccus sp. 1_MG-2023]|uniref:BadF/BadG/BcrA/BcrD ATPase family protein n=1 Tax=unclassified Paracoccus (in: a-proteobacteria) TaxID=2688777 RepID=UPI001C0A5736|nr:MULTISPECIES: BadF/BadG/BcrA/BcrD ATPase family protein [unclassified Paracoccus (in: a-proteobacteria)]MBU2956229.1 ATPase [Paracoccus sp. C2R09]MDO6667906.1 BadF/BadG/BcrA/BcrD ATPase family protein [Paracoccus sp. 1_MG-2023]